MEYTKEWITKVRGKMNKIDFGKRIYQFKKNGTTLCTVHRNTITNWEAGKTPLSKDKEVFLSIALLEYDQNHLAESSELVFKKDAVEDAHLDIEKRKQELQIRNDRYLYVRNLMNQMIGVDLYCRNLHDALLIQICRGILSFEELLPLELEIEKELSEMELSKEEKNEYAIERNTVFIDNDLLKVRNKEDLIQVILKQHKATFASANRTIGARISHIYNSRLRQDFGLPIAKAIANLAPNYRDSYLRMFTSSFISRNWLLDLCMHLHFTREEINEALDSAHMALLSDDIYSFEGNVRENDYTVGSSLWYMKLEMESKGRFGHYYAFREMPIEDRFKAILLIGLCIRDYEKEDELPPVDYLLEAFGNYDYGKRGMKEVTNLLESYDYDDAAFEEIEEKLENIKEDTIKQYIDSILYGINYEQEIADVLKEETKAYFAYDSDRLKSVTEKNIAGLMCYYAALCYTVLTGKYFTGALSEADIENIVEIFAKAEKEDNSLCHHILQMVTQFLGTFLSGLTIRELKKQGEILFYVENEYSKSEPRKFNMTRLLEDIWESILVLK